MEKNWFKSYPKNVAQSIDYSVYQNIYEVYQESINKFNSQPCFTNMGVSYTYEGTDQLVEKFASFLQHELKLKKGDRIAVQMPNLIQFPVAVFAALKIGLVVVNTNPLYTAKEMEHQFKDSGAKAIVILANYAHLLERIIKSTKIESVVITEIADLFPAPKRILVNSVVKYIKKMVPPYNIPQAYTFNQALKLGAKKTAVTISTTQKDIAFLQYTGGTTGVSKGAELTHANIISNMLQICEWMKPKLVPGKEVAITPLPMYHIFSLTLNCLTFMKYGANNVLITNPKDIPNFIKDLKKYPFSVMSGVNTLYNALANHPDIHSVDFSHLKISVAGATALQKAVAARWYELTKSKVIEGYGLTECSPVVCCNPIDGSDMSGTIGLPLPDTEVILIDDDGKEVTALGSPGELCVKGPQVMRGYWNRPDETNKVIVDGWLRTGDVATVDKNGFFKIVDRKKDMILVSGFNVYPNEVEDVIASMPGVMEVAAIGIPDQHSGEVVKVVIVKKDQNLSEKDVVSYAKKNLTGYKVPKVVEFRTELPKTNVGKILRRALRDEAQK